MNLSICVFFMLQANIYQVSLIQIISLVGIAPANIPKRSNNFPIIGKMKIKERKK